MNCARPTRFFRESWLIVIVSALGCCRLLAEEFTQEPALAPAEVRESQPAKTEAPAKIDPALQTLGPKPEWIWGPNENRQYTLTREFETEARSAILVASCDNQMNVDVNGQSVVRSTAWESPT